MIRINVKLDNYLSSVLSLYNTLPENRRRSYILLSLKKTSQIIIPPRLYLDYISEQRNDGGWCDNLETAINAYLLKDNYSSEYINARRWLNGNRNDNGAWGLTSRDIPRITTTSWILTLLPELVNSSCISWLEQEWRKDLASETKLTYKAALTLMAFASTRILPQKPSFIYDTVSYLMSEQNIDGGFAPWKNHPVGSEPWSTGICLIGLLSYPDLIKQDVIENCLRWLGKNQLSNGLWPCHYIEEGSAYCYWGAVEAMKYLKRVGL